MPPSVGRGGQSLSGVVQVRGPAGGLARSVDRDGHRGSISGLHLHSAVRHIDDFAVAERDLAPARTADGVVLTGVGQRQGDVAGVGQEKRGDDAYGSRWEPRIDETRDAVAK